MTETTYKIAVTTDLNFGITHGRPMKTKLLKKFSVKQCVSKVEVHRDAEGNYYLVLKE